MVSEIVKFLIEGSADINAGDGFTLRLAASRGHLETMRYLLEQGAGVHAQNAGENTVSTVKEQKFTPVKEMNLLAA